MLPRPIECQDGVVRWKKGNKWCAAPKNLDANHILPASDKTREQMKSDRQDREATVWSEVAPIAQAILQADMPDLDELEAVFAATMDQIIEAKVAWEKIQTAKRLHRIYREKLEADPDMQARRQQIERLEKITETGSYSKGVFVKAIKPDHPLHALLKEAKDAQAAAEKGSEDPFVELIDQLRHEFDVFEYGPVLVEAGQVPEDYAL
jgi:hypothetical protein